GLVGGDGATHQGVYDLAYLRAIPHVSVAMPRDADEMRSMLKAALALGGPKAIRWPRGGVIPPAEKPVAEWPDIEWGTWEVLKRPSTTAPAGGPVWLLGMGPTVGYALTAAGDRPDVGVVNARFVKPLDGALLRELGADARAIVTIEDHTVTGGLGSAVLEELAAARLPVSVIRLGIQDVNVPHGDPGLQHEELGYGPRAIARVLDELLGSSPTVAAPGPGEAHEAAMGRSVDADHHPER